MDKKYSVIVFDLGNVLIPFDYKVVIDRFNIISAGLGDKFMDAYMNNYHIHRQFERGELSEEEFINLMLNVLEQKVSRETFCDVYSNVFTVDQKVTGLLPILKQNHILVLLSNTNPIHRKYGWEGYDFLKYFDKLILSYEVGAYKPEEEIYKAAQAFTRKPPEEHLFIDDIAEYAQGARDAGWDAVQFKGYESLVEELRKRNILKD